MFALKFVDFFFAAHDSALILLAVAVCTLSSYACMSLLAHARRTERLARLGWTGIAALSVGFGIWATHFIAILAHARFEFGYDLLITATSAVVGILFVCMGLALAAFGFQWRDRPLAGAVVGVGISAMHYTGMAAVLLNGRIVWDHGVVAASVVLGMVISAVALTIGTSSKPGERSLGAIAMVGAICATHFTAMSAADFSQCTPVVNGGAVLKGRLSVVVAGVSLLVLLGVLAGAMLDRRERVRSQREEARQVDAATRLQRASRLLDAAALNMPQALCVFDEGGLLQFHNGRLLTILGHEAAGTDLIGTHFTKLLSTSVDPDLAMYRCEHPFILDEISAGRSLEYLVTPANGLIFKVVHSPIGDGSWVTTMDDITSQESDRRRAQHLARHDLLTGLLNRTAFADQVDVVLEFAPKSELKFAVIEIDVDRFKDINDAFGNGIGDQVLKVLGSSLLAQAKEGEVLARNGGDQFAAIKTFESVDELREFLARLDAVFFRCIEIAENLIEISASIGVAVFPGDGDTRETLLTNADLAMQRAKKGGDGRLAFYESGMDLRARERRAVARDIWSALATNGFSLAYQVQKSVQTGATTGYEVLLRWNRHGHGPTSPADFIPVAEECGAIVELGEWVLSTACMEAASWPEPHKIAVNVSGLQLGRVSLIDSVRQILARSGLDPHRLELEVTETSIIADKVRALHILRQIKAMGVSIAIDDFGTGYSSLDTLRSFPFDKIKLDRSFVQGLEGDEQSKAIVRAVLALGRSLSVPVLAEGVETEEQLEVLRAEGCSEVQGYLLGRPGVITWSPHNGPVALTG